MTRYLIVLLLSASIFSPVSGFGQERALSYSEYAREFMKRVVEPCYNMFGLITREEIEARKDKDWEKNQAHIRDTFNTVGTSEFFSHREMIYRIFRQRCLGEGELYVKVKKKDRWVNRRKKVRKKRRVKKPKPEWWLDPKTKRRTF